MGWSGNTIDYGNGQYALAVAAGDSSVATQPGGVPPTTTFPATPAALGPAIDVGGARLAAILIPAVWAVAVLTFQASADGVTWNDLYDDQGNEVTCQAVAGKWMGLDVLARPVGAFRFLKLRSGTSASPVNQAANAALVYTTRSS